MQNHPRSMMTGVIFLALLLILPVRAEETNSYDRIHLSVSAEQEVDADTVKAVLYIQEEGDELTPLTDRVNKMIKRAVGKSQQTPGIQVETLSYRTQPIYNKQHRSGWRVRQAMQLESNNVDVLTRLLGDLQGSLAIESISYHVSPRQRGQVEQALIKQAIEEFGQRANTITRQLGRERYRLVELSVNTDHRPVHPGAMRTLSVQAESRSSVPHIEPGRQTLQVTANGTIELVVD